METEIAMVEQKAPVAADELKAWYKPLLDATVSRLIKSTRSS